jgi:ABC-type bacteriocin/lantibiotic exporter with double-glycine peptidase domain
VVSGKAKALAIALTIDALFAVWIFVMNSWFLTWWLLANGVMVVVIMAVLFVRKSRRAARRTGRTSFSEYKKMHAQCIRR